MIEFITLSATVINTTILTAIYYKLGKHDEKHVSHEKRLTLLESRHYGQDKKTA